MATATNGTINGKPSSAECSLNKWVFSGYFANETDDTIDKINFGTKVRFYIDSHCKYNAKIKFHIKSKSVNPPLVQPSVDILVKEATVKELNPSTIVDDKRYVEIQLKKRNEYKSLSADSDYELCCSVTDGLICFIPQDDVARIDIKSCCYCNRDITITELMEIVENLRNETKYNDRPISAYHSSDKLFYLSAKVPKNDQTYIKFAEVLNKAFKKYGIAKCSHKIHFLAQMYVETMYYTSTREHGDSLTYDPYRGRGFMHLTHKNNYEAYQKETSINVVDNPEMVADDLYIAADTGAWYWKRLNINTPAEQDDLFKTSKLVNIPSATKTSQINGYENRRIAWMVLKKIFKYPDECSNNK